MGELYFCDLLEYGWENFFFEVKDGWMCVCGVWEEVGDGRGFFIMVSFKYGDLDEYECQQWSMLLSYVWSDWELSCGLICKDWSLRC